MKKKIFNWFIGDEPMALSLDVKGKKLPSVIQSGIIWHWHDKMKFFAREKVIDGKRDYKQ